MAFQWNKQDDNSQDSNQHTNTNNTSHSNHKWQWIENDGTWHDYDAATQLGLDNLSIGNKITITAGQWKYDITRTTNDQCWLSFH